MKSSCHLMYLTGGLLHKSLSHPSDSLYNTEFITAVLITGSQCNTEYFGLPPRYISDISDHQVVPTVSQIRSRPAEGDLSHCLRTTSFIILWLSLVQDFTNVVFPIAATFVILSNCKFPLFYKCYHCPCSYQITSESLVSRPFSGKFCLARYKGKWSRVEVRSESYKCIFLKSLKLLWTMKLGYLIIWSYSLRLFLCH